MMSWAWPCPCSAQAILVVLTCLIVRNVSNVDSPAVHENGLASRPVYLPAGPFGGNRAAAFARPLLSELGLVSIPAQLTVPTVTQNYSADGQPQNERVQKNADRLVRELTWYVDALKQARQDGTPN